MSDVVLFEAFVTSAAQSDGLPIGAAPAVPSGWLYTLISKLEQCARLTATRLGPPGHPTA